MFKTRLDTFGNDFGYFCNLERFLIFFENFRRIDPPWNTEQKNFEKINPKPVQNKFGHFWERFWAFLQFGKVFDFFLKIFEGSTLMEHWAKKILEKINPKHVQNTFGHFWERFWAFFQF